MSVTHRNSTVTHRNSTSSYVYPPPYTQESTKSYVHPPPYTQEFHEFLCLPSPIHTGIRGFLCVWGRVDIGFDNTNCNPCGPQTPASTHMTHIGMSGKDYNSIENMRRKFEGATPLQSVRKCPNRPIIHPRIPVCHVRGSV